LSAALVALTITFLIVSWARGLAQEGPLRYGDVVSGALTAGGSAEWVFVGEADDLVTLTAARTGGDLALALTVLDGAQPLAATQMVGGQADLFLQTRLSRAGSFVIRVASREGTAGEYRLVLALTSRTISTPTAMPTLATGGTVGSITYGQTVRGELGGSTFRQAWRLAGNAGLVVDILMSATAGDLDCSLALQGPDGTVLVSNESLNGGRDAAILAYQLPFNGEYVILARTGQTSTAGSYTLTLNARGSAPDAQASVLGFEAPIRGRLTPDQPRAIYRLASGGTVAFNMALDHLYATVNLRVLTAGGEEVARYGGLNPLLLVATLDQPGTYFAEISATTFQPAGAIEFEISAARLINVAGTPQALYPGQPRRSVLAAAPESWVFSGNVGDVVEFGVRPEAPASASTAAISVVLTSPQTITLYEGTLGTGLKQALILPAAGFYRLDLRPLDEPASQPPLAPVPYQVVVDRLGVDGLGFAALAAADQDEIRLGGTVRGTLLPNSAQGYWIDAEAGDVVSLVARGIDSPSAFGVALLDPSGSLVRAATGERFGRAALLRSVLEQRGRYRAVVFNRQAVDTPFTLQALAESGGLLTSGQPIKGVMPIGTGAAMWTFEASAGDLINAQLENLTPNAWTPRLLVVDPGGVVIASAAQTDGRADRADRIDILGLAAPVEGRYTIVVAGATGDDYAAYRLVANAHAPFGDEDSAAIAVNPVSATAAPVPAPATLPATPEVRYAPAPADSAIRVALPALVSRSIAFDALDQSRIVPIAFGSVIRGEIAAGEVRQAFRFSSRANLTFVISATSLEPGRSPDLILFDNNGRLLAEQYGGQPTTLVYRTQRGGSFTVVATMGLRSGRFLLSIAGETTATERLQVGAGTPLEVGQTVAGELRQAGVENRYYLFGRARDVISIQAARVTGDIVPSVEVLAPSGQRLVRDSNAAAQPALTISRLELTDNGLHTIIVRSVGSPTATGGRYFLTVGLTDTLRLRNRGGGTLAAGVLRTGYLSQNNPDDDWLFVGTQGEFITLTLAGLPTGEPLPLRLELRDTGGRLLAFAESSLAQDTLHIRDFLIATTGVYRVQVRGGRLAGLYSLALATRQHGSGFQPIQYGQTVSGYFTTERRSETWAFTGTAGDSVSVALRYLRGDRFLAGFQVFAENNLPLVTGAPGSVEDNARVTIVLPFNGTYSIVVANPQPDYAGAGVYSLSLSLDDTKARSLGAILHPGQAGQGDIFADDPGDTWLFSGRGADRLRLSVRGLDGFLKPRVELRDLGGNLLASAAGERLALLGDTLGDTNATFALPADGIYSVAITGASGTTGTYEVALSIAPRDMADLPLAYGETQNGVLDDNRPQDVYRFRGAQGDVIEATLTREPGASLAARLCLQTLDGRVLAYADAVDGDVARIRGFRLPAAGEYWLVASRFNGAAGTSVGRYSLTVSGVPTVPTVRSTIRYTQGVLGRLNAATPEERFTFQGGQGEVITVAARATSGDLDLTLRLDSPLGVTLAVNDDAEGVDARLDGVLLPADGLYTVIVSRRGVSIGNYELVVSRPYQGAFTPALAGTNAPPLVLYGQRLVGVLDEAAPATTYAFNGAQGDVITVRVLHEDDEAPIGVVIRDPAGNVLAQGRSAAGQTSVAGYVLPSDGRYEVELRRSAGSRTAYGPYAMSIELGAVSATPALDGGVVDADGVVIGTFAAGQTAHYWLLKGAANDTLSLQVQRLAGNIQPTVLLVAPTGQGVASISATPDTGAFYSLPLPTDGVYSLVVLPGGEGKSGQYRLSILKAEAGTASTPPPVSRVITPGQTQRGTLTPVESRQAWSFVGRGGQVITAQVLTVEGTLQPALHLLSPEGRILAEGARQQTAQGVLSAITGYTLPATGVHTLVVSAGQASAGDYLLTLDDGNVTISVPAAQPLQYGQPVRSVLQGGNTALWSFEGAGGDAVSLGLELSHPNGDSPAATLELRTLNGRVLASARGGGESGEIDLPAVLLPEAGRYLVAIRPDATVGYTLTVERRQDYLPAEVTLQPLTPNTPRAETISDADSFDYWRFTGQAGDLVALSIERISGRLRADLTLFGPSGYLTSAVMLTDARLAEIAPLRLPDDGSYTLVVTRWLGGVGTTNGNYRLTLRRPPPETPGLTSGALAGYGVPVAVALPEPTTATAPAANWTFEGSAGDVVSVFIRPLSGGPFEIAVFAPGNPAALPATREEGDGGQGEIVLREVVLPSTGQYTVTITNATASATANASPSVARLQVDLVRSASPTPANISLAGATGIGYNTVQPGEISRQTPIQVWVFAGRAGERVVIRVQAAPSEPPFDPFVQLLAPDGKIIAADDNGGGGLRPQIANLQLPLDGFYAIAVSGSPTAPQDQRDGLYTLALSRSQPGSTFLGTIRDGETVSSTLTADYPIQEWQFSAQAGQTVAVAVSVTAPGFSGTIQIVAADGRVVATSAPSRTPSLEVTIPAPGQYSVVIYTGQSAVAANYRLTRSASASATGGGFVMINGEAVGGVISDEDFSDQWRLEVRELKPLEVDVARTEGDLAAEVVILAPDGAVIGGGVVGALPRRVTPPAPGLYTVIVTRVRGALGATTGKYVLSIRQ
jgi:hypothetical protein